MPDVLLLPVEIRAVVRDDESIVDGLRRAGVRTPYKCRRGGCGTCKARLVSGAVTYADVVAETVLSPAEQTDGWCLPCRARPVGDVVLDLGDAPVTAVLAWVPAPAR